MVDDATLAAACDVVLAQITDHPKAWVGNADYAAACAYIRATAAGETSSRIAVCGNAFIMFGIDANWWSAKPVLHEQLLLSLDGKAVDMSLVIAYLELVARIEGAAGVVFGTSLSRRDPALIRLYSSHGYANEATMLYKEIT